MAGIYQGIINNDEGGLVVLKSFEGRKFKESTGVSNFVKSESSIGIAIIKTF